MATIEPIDLGEEADRSRWPRGVKPIGYGQMDKIGVDAEGRLYWDGKRVEVSRRLDLSTGERWFALIVGAFTIMGSIGAVAQGWAAAHQWSCQAGYTAKGCPPK